MRILQLGRFYPPHMGGIETVLFEITEGLNDKGVQCDVLCSNNIPKLEISEFKNYKVIRSASFGNFLSTSISPQLILQLRKIMNNYDIIHLHHPDPMATVALLLSDFKKKIILHWHSDIIRQKFALFFYKPIQELILKRCDKIIVTSENYLQASLHLKNYRHKAEVIPIGIRPDFYSNSNGKEAFEKGEKTIVFALGRHVYYKGFEYLIESARYLDDSFLILIGGKGPLSDSLRKRIKDLNVADKVRLVGKIPKSEMASFFQACSIFCLPSIERTEAFGVVIIEAMSFRKAIVTTNIPGSGVNWVNQDEKTGINVAPRNSRALAEAFIKIAGNQHLRKEFERQSELRFNQLFSREVMIDKLMDLYYTI